MTTPINEIPILGTTRVSTGFKRLNDLLGGGFIPGQAVLFSGEPGVGKSTLVLQLAENFSIREETVLYVSGEESLGQIKLRATRLNALNPKILCSENILLEEILLSVVEVNPSIVIVDSLQMTYSNTLRYPPGSPVQMRFCLNALIKMAKSENRILIVIGHTTKSGLIGGLLTLQHMVDTTFLMRTNPETNIRQLEIRKNRFGEAGTAWEVAMTPQGIVDATISDATMRGFVNFISLYRNSP